MRKALFGIDGFEGEYEGYTNGQVWNGWACPYFTKEEGEKIMEELASDHFTKAYYDESRDAFVVDSEDHDEPEFFGANIIDGEALYPIGNQCWVWDELESSAQALPDLPEPDSVRELWEFKAHMSRTILQLHDDMDNDRYEGKQDDYKLHIEFNGKRVSLDIHAQLYDNLTQFIDRAIKEEDE